MNKKTKLIEKWVVITDLINCSLSNANGVVWIMDFSRFSSLKRKMISGSIGWLGQDGKIIIRDPSKHRVIITEAKASWIHKDIGIGGIVWLEKQMVEEDNEE